MKKLLTVAALLASTALAGAAYLPAVTGPQDPSQINATINQLQQNINNGVNGLIGAFTTTTNSTATTAEQTLASISVPANTLLQNGQTLRLRCSGVVGSTAAHSATIKLYYGTSSISSGSGNGGASYDLSLQVTYDASATAGKFVGTGLFGATVVTPVATSNTTDDMRTALTAKCTTTQNTASASDTTLMNFLVEQVK